MKRKIRRAKELFVEWLLSLFMSYLKEYNNTRTPKLQAAYHAVTTYQSTRNFKFSLKVGKKFWS